MICYSRGSIKKPLKSNSIRGQPSIVPSHLFPALCDPPRFIGVFLFFSYFSIYFFPISFGPEKNKTKKRNEKNICVHLFIWGVQSKIHIYRCIGAIIKNADRSTIDAPSGSPRRWYVTSQRFSRTQSHLITHTRAWHSSYSRDRCQFDPSYRPNFFFFKKFMVKWIWLNFLSSCNSKTAGANYIKLFSYIFLISLLRSWMSRTHIYVYGSG